ncbi:hypothetical protein T4E_429 [Trichinella pseudospiralis]|uniref:Uncharacterized protein n=1 Tax=Trichinella pseudospiralis TaxID=6337 RepID=A0A0V0Y7U0_TRIPS|nr:hypothetical protein T4E_429 [Trichinella pseudospiralis]
MENLVFEIGFSIRLLNRSLALLNNKLTRGIQLRLYAKKTRIKITKTSTNNKNNYIDECTVINRQLMDQIKQLEVALVKSNSIITNLKQQRDRMKTKTRMLKVKLEKCANWSIKQSTEPTKMETIPADRRRLELPKMAMLKKLKTCKNEILSLGDVSLLGIRSRTVAEHLTEEVRNAADFFQNDTKPSEREISLQQKLEKMEIIYQQLNNKVDYLETVGNRIRKTSDNLWSTCQQLWCNQEILMKALSLDDEALELAGMIWPALPEHLSVMQVAESFHKLNTNSKNENFNSSKFSNMDILSIKQRVSDLLKQREKIVSALVATDYIEEPLNDATSTVGCMSTIEEQLTLENIVLTEELFNYKEEILKLKQRVNHLDSTVLTLRQGVQSSDKELKIYRDLCYQLENEIALFKSQNPYCAQTEQDMFNLILQINQALSECKNITCQLGNERSELLKQNLDLIDQLSQAKMSIISSRQRAIKKHKKHLAIFQNIIKKLTEKFEIQITEIPLNGNEYNNNDEDDSNTYVSLE